MIVRGTQLILDGLGDVDDMDDDLQAYFFILYPARRKFREDVNITSAEFCTCDFAPIS
jgi:hypothetical protein